MFVRLFALLFIMVSCEVEVVPPEAENLDEEANKENKESEQFPESALSKRLSILDNRGQIVYKDGKDVALLNESDVTFAIQCNGKNFYSYSLDQGKNWSETDICRNKLIYQKMQLDHGDIIEFRKRNHPQKISSIHVELVHAQEVAAKEFKSTWVIGSSAYGDGSLDLRLELLMNNQSQKKLSI